MGFQSSRLKKAAAEYLRGQPPVQPAQLQQLLSHAETYLLVTTPGLRLTAAHEAVLAAWSEIAAEQARCYVDLQASTPQLLVIVDEVTKTRRLFPAADLVRILGPRVAAA